MQKGVGGLGVAASSQQRKSFEEERGDQHNGRAAEAGGAQCAVSTGGGNTRHDDTDTRHTAYSSPRGPCAHQTLQHTSSWLDALKPLSPCDRDGNDRDGLIKSRSGSTH